MKCILNNNLTTTFDTSGMIIFQKQKKEQVTGWLSFK